MKARKILLVVFLLLAIAASIGFYLFNEGPVNVKNASAIKVSANELYKDFTSDSIHAQKKYSGKIVSVNAIVSSTTVNQEGEMLILLSTETPGAYINCTMEKKETKVVPEQPITVKGICSGIGQGDADLGIAGDVYLGRCYLIK